MILQGCLTESLYLCMKGMTYMPLAVALIVVAVAAAGIGGWQLGARIDNISMQNALDRELRAQNMALYGTPDGSSPNHKIQDADGNWYYYIEIPADGAEDCDGTVEDDDGNVIAYVKGARYYPAENCIIQAFEDHAVGDAPYYTVVMEAGEVVQTLSDIGDPDPMDTMYKIGLWRETSEVTDTSVP